MQKSVVLTTGNSNDDTCMYVSEPVQTYMTCIFSEASQETTCSYLGNCKI